MIPLVVPRRTKGLSPSAVDRKLLFVHPDLNSSVRALRPYLESTSKRFLQGSAAQQTMDRRAVPTRPRLTIKLGVTQLVDKCTESRPIAPEYGQDGTCAARPISSISCTKTVQLRNSFSTC